MLICSFCWIPFTVGQYPKPFFGWHKSNNMNKNTRLSAGCMLEASGSQRCSNRSRAIRGSPFLGPVPQWWTGAFSIYRFPKIETINNNYIQLYIPLCFKSGIGQESSATGTSLMCKYTMFHHFCTLHGKCSICSCTKRYLVLSAIPGCLCASKVRLLIFRDQGSGRQCARGSFSHRPWT